MANLGLNKNPTGLCPNCEFGDMTDKVACPVCGFTYKVIGQPMRDASPAVASSSDSSATLPTPQTEPEVIIAPVVDKAPVLKPLSLKTTASPEPAPTSISESATPDAQDPAPPGKSDSVSAIPPWIPAEAPPELATPDEPAPPPQDSSPEPAKPSLLRKGESATTKNPSLVREDEKATGKPSLVTQDQATQNKPKLVRDDEALAKKPSLVNEGQSSQNKPKLVRETTSGTLGTKSMIVAANNSGEEEDPDATQQFVYENEITDPEISLSPDIPSTPARSTLTPPEPVPAITPPIPLPSTGMSEETDTKASDSQSKSLESEVLDLSNFSSIPKDQTQKASKHSLKYVYATCGLALLLLLALIVGFFIFRSSDESSEAVSEVKNLANKDVESKASTAEIAEHSESPEKDMELKKQDEEEAIESQDETSAAKPAHEKPVVSYKNGVKLPWTGARMDSDGALVAVLATNLKQIAVYDCEQRKLIREFKSPTPLLEFFIYGDFGIGVNSVLGLTCFFNLRTGEHLGDQAFPRISDLCPSTPPSEPFRFHKCVTAPYLLYNSSNTTARLPLSMISDNHHPAWEWLEKEFFIRRSDGKVRYVLSPCKGTLKPDIYFRERNAPNPMLSQGEAGLYSLFFRNNWKGRPKNQLPSSFCSSAQFAINYSRSELLYLPATQDFLLWHKLTLPEDGEKQLAKMNLRIYDLHPWEKSWTVPLPVKINSKNFKLLDKSKNLKISKGRLRVVNRTSEYVSIRLKAKLKIGSTWRKIDQLLGQTLPTKPSFYERCQFIKEDRDRGVLINDQGIPYAFEEKNSGIAFWRPGENHWGSGSSLNLDVIRSKVSLWNSETKGWGGINGDLLSNQFSFIHQNLLAVCSSGKALLINRRSGVPEYSLYNERILHVFPQNGKLKALSDNGQTALLKFGENGCLALGPWQNISNFKSLLVFNKKEIVHEYDRQLSNLGLWPVPFLRCDGTPFKSPLFLSKKRLCLYRLVGQKLVPIFSQLKDPICYALVIPGDMILIFFSNRRDECELYSLKRMIFKAKLDSKEWLDKANFPRFNSAAFKAKLITCDNQKTIREIVLNDADLKNKTVLAKYRGPEGYPIKVLDDKLCVEISRHGVIFDILKIKKKR